MSKLFGKFLKGSSLLALVAAPAVVFAAPSTGPISPSCQYNPQNLGGLYSIFTKCFIEVAYSEQ